MARVVVIGAGMGGMATAARLAVKKHDVTIVEQSHTYGGKLGTVERDGFVFDTGPSLLTIPAVYRDLFNKTGMPLEKSIEIVDLDPAFGYHFSDGTTLDMPGFGVGRCAAAMQDVFGGTSGQDWRDFSARAADIWQITRRPVLESPLSGMRDFMPLAKDFSAIRTVAPFRSLRSIAAKYLADPRQRTLVDRYATYTGSDPRKAPAALATVPYVEQTFGAYHVAGGIRKLADALYERVIERGVDVRFNADVARLELTNDRACGVTLASGERLPADIVVSNADARHLYQDLVQDPRGSAALQKLSKATASLSGFVILVAARGRTPGIRHHNGWFPSNYDDEFDSIFGRNPRPVPDPTIYACVPDDDQMRPDSDHESWFILVNAPRHSDVDEPGCINWDAPGLADQYRDRIFDVLAQRGIDLRERALWTITRTPADLERATRAPGGSIYGTSSNGARAAFLRPANISPIPRLYLVGGSAHPGGGLPLVGMSAEIVANIIGRDADESQRT